MFEEDIQGEMSRGKHPEKHVRILKSRLGDRSFAIADPRV